MEKSIKKQLHELLLGAIEEQLKNALERMDEALEAVKSDTKSTAGDKHETGRAMAQLEQEKAGKLIQSIKHNRNHLLQLPLTSSDKVELGALVKTTKGRFYISMAMGKISLDGVSYFTVSPSAPLVQAMMKKKLGDKFSFNNIEQEILKIQ